MSFKVQSVKTLFAILFITLGAMPAIAHPHILIDAQVKFHLTKSANQTIHLQKLNYIWEFDENFSFLLLGDYDDDQNQLLNQDELSTMGIETMEGAKALDYFTHLSAGQNQIIPTDAPQVLATYKDNRLTLEFDLTLPEPIEITANFKFALFDDEYYTAFMFAADTGLKIVQDSTINCQITALKIREIDENMLQALERAFSQDTINQGLGKQFADEIGIKCA